MEKIGFLFGEEFEFPQAVMEVINSNKDLDIRAEELKLGIINLESLSQYKVIFDRFSDQFPFYKSALRFLEKQGIKVINKQQKDVFDDNFLCSAELKKLKINVPKMAIIPSKALPIGVEGDMLRNLIYPLNWNAMFERIGFPANVMLNNSKNGFYDSFTVYNPQEFHSIYDMSTDKTVILQQLFEDSQEFCIFVVGEENYIIDFDINKPLKDRHSESSRKIDEKHLKTINTIIKKCKKHFGLDIFELDCVLAENKIYVNHINKNIQNIDSLFLPEECYNWLVTKTADLLINHIKTS